MNINGRVVSVPVFQCVSRNKHDRNELAIHTFLFSLRSSNRHEQMLFIVALTFRRPLQAEAYSYSIIRDLGNTKASPSGSLSQLKLRSASTASRGVSTGSGNADGFVVFERPVFPLLMAVHVQHSSGFVPNPGTATMLVLN